LLNGYIKVSMDLAIKICAICLVSLAFSCSKKPVGSVGKGNNQSQKMLLLKVDFLKRNFEGGKELNFNSIITSGDSLPLKKLYESPSDFGNITFLYRTTNDTVFSGDIVWMGTGRLIYPRAFDTSSTFKKLKTMIEKPVDSRFQELHRVFYQNKDTIPWTAINNLEIVQTYLQYNKKVGYFIYTPSVGVGDPAEWDWIFVFSN
jgi:hypothetical protein